MKKEATLKDLSDENPRIQSAPNYDIKAAAEYLPSLDRACSVVDRLPQSNKLISYGFNFSDDILAELECEILTLHEECDKLSLLMVDLNTLGGVAYNIGQTYCCQSTIKAVAVGAMLEDNYDNAIKASGRLMRDAIVDSSNEAYEILYNKYGNQAIKKWAVDIGVDPNYVSIMYPRLLTARDMVKFWTKLYNFFNSGTDKDNFSKYYAATLASATSEVLGERIPVQTKAGWEDMPQSPHDECSCHDCGIVYASNGPYLFAIFTGIPYEVPEENPLKSLVGLLYRLHSEI